MLPIAPAWLVVMLAQASPSPSGSASAQPPSPRGVDCAQLVGRASVWDRARAPQLGHYCDLLAQAEARLGAEPKRADEAARAAQAAVPGQAAPLVLRARAAFSLGQYAEAAGLFEQARAIDPKAGDEPSSLFALAASRRETGDAKGAAAAYRALVPRVAGLPSAETRSRALLEAGLAVLGEGPSSVDEAIAVLRVAASPDAPSTRPLALAALALALDRQGARGEAAAAASEGQHHGALVALERPIGRERPVARRDDTLALVARLREVAEPHQAIPAWEAFLASAGGGPWGAHARQKLADLRKGGGRRRGR